MFFIAASLVGRIRGDFVYRKVTAKNIIWDDGEAQQLTQSPPVPGAQRRPTRG